MKRYTVHDYVARALAAKGIPGFLMPNAPEIVDETERFYRYARAMYGLSRSGADRWLAGADSEQLDGMVDQVRDADKLLRFKSAWDRLSSEQRQQVVDWVEVLSATGRQVDRGPAEPAIDGCCGKHPCTRPGGPMKLCGCF